MLTPKQEKFVQNLIAGMSQREAYRDAYDTDNMSDNAVDVEACRLFANPKVSLRYKEIQNMLARPTIMTAQERLEYLSGIVTDTRKEKIVQVIDGEMKEIEVPASLKVKLNAIDIMNKMQGEYVQKIEADVNSEVSINITLED